MRGLIALACVAIAGCFDPDVVGPDPGPAESDECREPGVLCTLIGSGMSSAARQATRPLETGLYMPNDVAVDPDTGTVYVIDFNNYVIRALAADGFVHMVAGNGDIGDLVEGPALQ